MALKIDTGLVSGVPSHDGRSQRYLGIPFAAPPVGPLRWKPPQPAAAWSRTRHCDRFGPAPVQQAQHAQSIMRQFSFDEPPECGTNEDCLYLNVWAPASPPGKLANGPAPVIVFVFGGGHRVGSGSHAVSRGDALAAQGAVVVTFNYRLGAMGYLAHPELTRESGASGNYACLDVIAALEWVRRNIAAFGGDPDCVTLFGQSAGAALVNVLMASPLASELFQRAIVHSSGRFKGGPMGAPLKRLAEAERAGAAMAGALGARTLNELRALAPDAIDAPRGFWGPIIDGDVLREPVQDVFERGDQIDVPLLAGYTRDEATPYPTPELHSRAKFLAYADATFGAQAEQFLQLFPCADDAGAVASSYALRRDTAFAYQAWKFASLHAKTARSPVYLFNFVHPPPFPPERHFHEPVPPGGYGAHHGCELWFAFNTLDAAPRPARPEDRELADAMSSAWIAFARSGNPNAPSLPPWPSFRITGQAMHLGERCYVAEPFNAQALAFFDRHFAKMSHSGEISR
jgi:para-nitrobenzyl esterase